MVILTTIYVAVAVLLLFASAIFIHEWGHFFVARLCGMKVEEFAIGFGKILWKREKDGVLYTCLLYTSPSPRDRTRSRMPSSA